MYQGFSISVWFTTTNHKKIGLLYIVTSIYFLIIAGGIAELIRTQQALPNGPLLSVSTYSQAVSLHGLIMILWFLSPLAVGLANYFVPLQIGAKDMAFPRLNAMSYWLYLFSGLTLAGTVFLPGGTIDTGWTLYAPLNTLEYTPQPGMTLGILAIAMLAVSVTMSSINFITTIVRTRTKGMTWTKLPVFSWSVLFTNGLMLFAFPPLAVGISLLVSDRVFGTVFFSSIEGGSILWDQLFWFFGHPEVYIVVLPALGIMAEVISTFSRKPLFAKKVFIAELAAVTVLSVAVWVHHMFLTGISFGVREVFMLTTLAISIPFEGLVLNLVLTPRGGSVKLTTPMLYALGAVFLVILGGITGIFQASIPLDYQFRGTYWVVGHFHYVMVGTTIFGLLAGLYYWFPRITGKMYNEKAGKILFAVSFLGFNLLYFPFFFLWSMPRRIVSYAANPEWWPFNLASTVGAFIFGPAVLIAIAILIHSYIKGKQSAANPWNSDGAEWPAKSVSGLPPVTATDGGQKSPPQEEGPREIVSYLPVVIALGVSLFLTGFVLFVPLAIAGLIVIGVSVVKWFRDDIREKYAELKESISETFPVARTSKEKVGMWIFLTSEVVIFGSLIISYLYVRVRSDIWPATVQTHNLAIGTTDTIILLTSSLTMILSLQAIRNGNLRLLKAGLAGTFALGATFLVLKLIVEWPQEFANGFVITGGIAPSAYYTLMGAHALHVGVGLAALSYLMTKSLAGRFNAEKHTSVELLGLYWTFVDIVWMFLFPLFYLI